MSDFFVSREILTLAQKLTPSQKERKKVDDICKEAISKLEANIKRNDIDAVPSLHGSVAKDTWLTGETVNLDIFVAFSEKYGEEEIKRLGLKIGKLYDYEIAYAEHPYVKNFTRGVTIDVVPCFSAGRMITSVDRTPLHTAYIKTRLKEEQKKEVRLLKKFMKAQNVYGAEQKVGGFSGYLCELLVLHYGNLKETLEASSNWEWGERIDMEGISERKFSEPLVVVDPTDPDRNVAAAVVPKRLSEFIHSSRLILENPSPKFFAARKLVYRLNAGSKMFVLEFKSDMVDDVLFPQLRKTERYITSVLEREGFSVYDSMVFQGGIFLELDIFCLPSFERRMGPSIFDRENCARFSQKHKRVFVEELNLATEMRRKHRTAGGLLREIVRKKEGFGKTLKECGCRLYETKKAPEHEMF